MFVFFPEQRSGATPAAYFHAMARLGVEGLVLIEPRDFSVNLGCFDDLAAIDLSYCRQQHWPVMRREAGGGTVLLGPGQVFYQLVLRKGRPLTLGSIASVLRSLSRAPIEAYRLLGVAAEYRPATDLVTHDQRKISGQGAAEIDGCLCFVGSVLMRFDPATMARVLRTETPSHRAAVLQAMMRHMTWLDRELPVPPGREVVLRALRDGFASLFDVLEERTLPRAVVAEAVRIAEAFSTAEALDLDTPRRRVGIKIREGVSVHRRMGSIAGRECEAVITVCDEALEQISLSGLDRPDIEAALAGQTHRPDVVSDTLGRMQLAPDLIAALTALIGGQS